MIIDWDANNESIPYTDWSSLRQKINQNNQFNRTFLRLRKKKLKFLQEMFPKYLYSISSDNCANVSAP